MVVLVLGTVANDVLDRSVVPADRDRKANHGVASHNHFKVVLRDSGLSSCSVEEQLNLL
jgi:hypothetical protein